MRQWGGRGRSSSTLVGFGNCFLCVSQDFLGSSFPRIPPLVQLWMISMRAIISDSPLELIHLWRGCSPGFSGSYLGFSVDSWRILGWIQMRIKSIKATARPDYQGFLSAFRHLRFPDALRILGNIIRSVTVDGAEKPPTKGLDRVIWDSPRFLE